MGQKERGRPWLNLEDPFAYKLAAQKASEEFKTDPRSFCRFWNWPRG